MGNQYHQTLKFEKISGKSATFLFTLEINSTKREKTIPPLLLQRAPHIFCKDVRMSKFGAVTPNGKHSVFVIRICFSIVNVFSRCNGRGAGARYNRDWVQSNQTEIWTCFYQVFLIQLKRQFFSFFAIPIIEENMCSNTLQQRQAHSSRDHSSKKRISRIWTKKVADFQGIVLLFGILWYWEHIESRSDPDFKQKTEAGVTFWYVLLEFIYPEPFTRKQK